MSRKVYYTIAVAILIGVAGLVGAQVSGTKPASSAVVTEKEKPEALTLEERVINLGKTQEKILAELKVIKENQAKIMELDNKIYTRMSRR